MKNKKIVDTQSSIQPVKIESGINKTETLKTSVSYSVKKESEDAT